MARLFDRTIPLPSTGPWDGYFDVADPRLTGQHDISHGLAPGENLARVQPISPRHRADARSGHQCLAYYLLLIGPALAPPAFDRD